MLTLDPSHERTPDGVTSAVESQNQTFRERNDNTEAQADAQGSEVVESVDPVRAHVELIHRLAEGINGRIVVAGFGEEPDPDGETGRRLHPKAYHVPVGDVENTLAHIKGMLAEPHRNVYMPLVAFRPDLPPGKRGGRG